MTAGLAISGVINVDVSLTPRAIGMRNFGAALIAGDIDVIDVAERIRQYATLEEVAADFGTTLPEYKAAALHFSQTPQSDLLYIGRWARTPTAAVLHGRELSSSERNISHFNQITSGSFKIEIDGTAEEVDGLNFSTAPNLNGVAALITAGFAGAATVLWDASRSRFDVISDTTGALSSIGYATAGASGTNISGLLGIAASDDTPAPVAGVGAETAVQAAAILVDYSSRWYALEWACEVPPTDDAYVEVSELVEGQAIRRVHGITTTKTGNKDHTIENSLSTRLKDLGYNSTFVQYSSRSPYAVASLWSRFSTINFEAQNTTITAKFKTEPGVVAEFLTETEAATLRSRNCNVFVQYQNDAAIIQEGVMSGGWFIDERLGLDWLQNAIQTDVFNLFYTTPTKIPQTDAGTALIATTVAATLDRAVNNGLIAPGQWNGPPIGQVAHGDNLPRGYYIYTPLVATQSQADREARKSVPIQVLIKLAGAVHSADVLVSVNR